MMVRSRGDSEIRVWSSDYINNIAIRAEEHKDLLIEQIEPTGYGDTYLVEVFHKKPDGKWKHL